MRRNSPSEPPPVFQPEDLEVETTDGRRPAGTAGDRLMVGLAALALMGGALIAITNALPDDPTEASHATATAIPSLTPQPTSSPPPARIVQVDTDPSPVPDPIREGYVGWISALEKVKIRSHSSRSGSVVATLQPGDAARVEELSDVLGGATPGWMRLVAPASGWIQPKIDGRSVIRRYSQVDDQPAGWIEKLAAGVDGFAGVGWIPPTRGDYVPQLLVSADGAHWRVANTPELRSGDQQIAHGPAGWLLISTFYGFEGPAVPWVWQSTDLDDWQLLGSLPNLPDGIAQLVGSERGYVAAADNAQSIWFSTDGLVWTERPNPVTSVNGYVRLTSTPLGFYLDEGSGEGGPVSTGSTAAFSPDGWTWSEVATDGMDTIIGLAVAGDQLVALERSSGGDGRAWIGSIRGTILDWKEDASARAAFEGAAMTTIASDGQRPIAFGWERGSDVPLWWTRDGRRWERHKLPAEFGGLPHLAAGGPAGYVLLGERPSLAGANPLIWHLTGGATWESEPSPLIDVVADPPLEDCGHAPRDLLEIMYANSQRLAYCFGDRPLTFRAWSAPCDGCSYDGPGTSEPEWLAQPSDLLFLSPIANGDWDWVEGVLSPSLQRDTAWQEQWLRVTGHFNDAASTDCRLEPDLSEEESYEGRGEVIDGCRGRFVITAVTVVRGP